MYRETEEGNGKTKLAIRLLFFTRGRKSRTIKTFEKGAARLIRLKMAFDKFVRMQCVTPGNLRIIKTLGTTSET